MGTDTAGETPGSTSMLPHPARTISRTRTADAFTRASLVARGSNMGRSSSCASDCGWTDVPIGWARLTEAKLNSAVGVIPPSRGHAGPSLHP